MTFNPGARLDPDQVTDVRGRSGGGRTLAFGGGGLGLVIAIAYLLLGGDPSALLTQDPGGVVEPNSSALAECQTGADANAHADCRIVGFVNSIQAYWSAEVKAEGGTYRPAQTVLYTDAVNTGCGAATSEVGPFYCPPDEAVYLDLGFFDELQSRFGAEGGPLAEAYVVSHEYGHHIQNLQGILQTGSSATGAESRSVRTELQADCYAGIWVNHAASTGYLQPPTDAQIKQALDAAAAVGDDRIQSKTQGQVNPEAWTHGSAEQRTHWFTVGFTSGKPADCDTFSGDI
jgi:predicted metalloprotease